MPPQSELLAFARAPATLGFRRLKPAPNVYDQLGL